MTGYWNEIITTDLTEKKIGKRTLGKTVWKRILGGSGLGAYLLYTDVPKGTAAYDPENMLIFATGPFQASKLSGVGKWSVVSKSPMNGYYGEANAGGDFGINLKRTGYDALTIEGKSETPCYIYIGETDCEIRDAKKLWNLDSYETIDKIKKDLEEDVSVAAIGQAGENLVRFACITVDKHSFAGRTGMGAVMGSKKVKAIAVKDGNLDPPVTRTEKLEELQKEVNQALVREKTDYRKLGTPGSMDLWEETGDVPIKNWREGSWKEGNEKLAPPKYNETILEGRKPCKFCVVGCHREVEVEESEKYEMEGAGPEYETLGMIGENCLIDDLKCVAKANDLCNRYGMDTISTGSLIGFLMEAREKNHISEDVLESDLEWGNGDAALEIIEKIRKRNGIGNVLGEGISKASEKLGEETKDYAMHVKKVDVPAHDPRAHFAGALNYATGVRGPGHERGNLQMPYHGILLPEAGIWKNPDRFSMENIEYLTARYQDWSSLYNSLVMCRFMVGDTVGFGKQVDILNAITGWGFHDYDVLKMGERIFNLQRLVNIKFGMRKDEEKLPDRFYKTTDEGGHAGEAPENLEPHLEKYYEMRGWDERGIPTKETIQRLGLGMLIDPLPII